MHAGGEAIGLKVGNGNNWPIMGIEGVGGGECREESGTCTNLC